MKVEEALKRVKKIEKRHFLANETLTIILLDDQTERIIKIPLSKSTHNQ